jgi:tetratricopeptide (TPR) repeat protein
MLKRGNKATHLQEETDMRTIQRMSKFLLAMLAMLAVPFAASAYEVQVLTGSGSESKALEDGNYEVAIKRLERRTQHNSPATDIQLTNLCTAYVVTGRFDQARDVCDRAVEADGDYVGTAFNSRAVLNAVTGDYIAALDDFERAADQSNYPRPREYFGDKAPSMQRFSTPQVEIAKSIELAAKNFEFADRRWAALQEEADDLTAGVR